MKALSNSEYAKLAMALAHPGEKFEPTATYDPDGDCIEFIARPDSFYAERIDDLVTVYYSHETDEIVGSLIKRVSHFCKTVLQQFPGFMIEVQDGKVRLQHLFRARLWTGSFEPGDVTVLKYQKLIEVAEEADTEADVCLAP